MKIFSKFENRTQFQNVNYYLFQAERYVSILTVGAMMTAAVHPTLAVDHALAILVPLHTHWGLEQVNIS